LRGKTKQRARNQPASAISRFRIEISPRPQNTRPFHKQQDCYLIIRRRYQLFVINLSLISAGHTFNRPLLFRGLLIRSENEARRHFPQFRGRHEPRQNQVLGLVQRLVSLDLKTVVKLKNVLFSGGASCSPILLISLPCAPLSSPGWCSCCLNSRRGTSKSLLCP